MKRLYRVNKRIDPGEEYDYTFVLTSGLSVYSRSKSGGPQRKVDHVVLGPTEKPHSIHMTGPDGTDFVFDSEGIRRQNE